MMMLLDQAVVERLNRDISGEPEINRRKIGEFLFDRGLTNFDDRDGAITL